MLFNFSNAFASEYVTNFTKEAFEQAQNNGKTVVVYSWNKYCFTCAKQKPILKQAKKEFEGVLFLYIEHTKNKNLLKGLNISKGKVCHKGVSDTFGLIYSEPQSLLK